MAGVLVAAAVMLGIFFGHSSEPVPGGQQTDGFQRCLADPADWLHPLQLPPPLSTFPASHNDSLLWGSYRPAVYFGLRTRTFPSAMFGIFWHGASLDKARHQCSESDPVVRYGWEEHDGRTYGKQRIVDDSTDGGVGATLHTSFVKPAALPPPRASSSHVPSAEGVQWAARVRVERSTQATTSQGPVVVFLYFGLDCDGELSSELCAERAHGGGGDTEASEGLGAEKAEDGSVRIDGSSQALGMFSLRVSVDADGTAGVGTSMWGGSGVVMADVQARVTSMLSKRTKRKGGKKPRLAPLPDKVQKGSNVVVVRVSCKAECTIDTVLRQSSTSQVPPVAAASIDVWLQSGSKQFAEKFSQVFGDLDNFPDKDKRAAAAALSNAIGVSQSPLVD